MPERTTMRTVAIRITESMAGVVVAKRDPGQSPPEVATGRSARVPGGANELPLASERPSPVLCSLHSRFEIAASINWKRVEWAQPAAEEQFDLGSRTGSLKYQLTVAHDHDPLIIRRSMHNEYGVIPREVMQRGMR